MSSFLLIYGTSEGQTGKVADRIVRVLTTRGHDARAVNIKETPSTPHLDDFDAILIGSSIHVGKHQASIRQFVDANRDVLATKPTAFFQVSLSSATESGRAQAAGYVETFLDETEWHPDRIGLFGGALRYSQYGFLKRLMMKQIATDQLPDVDTSRDVEFTDWADVEAFAADVAAFVEGRLGVTPPAEPSRDPIE